MRRVQWGAGRLGGSSLVAGAWVAAVVAVGCGGQGASSDRAGTDLASADSARGAGVGAPPVRGQKAGPATGGAGAACDTPAAGATTPDILANPRDDKAETAQLLDDYLERLCFGLDDPRDIDRRFPVASGTVAEGDALWLQAELRMPNTDPDRLERGHGLIVAKIRNASTGPLRAAYWHGVLQRDHDAYLWMGKDGNDSAYSVVFLRKDASGKIKLLAGKAGDPSRWEHNTSHDPRPARVLWNPHALDKGEVRALQKPGSGWVACSPGCCTAIDLNVAK